jgi:hypothetical protein
MIELDSGRIHVRRAKNGVDSTQTERIEGRPSITRFSAADAVIPVTLATCQPARSAAWRSSSSWLDVV